MARTSIDRLGSLQKAVMEAVWGLGEATVQQVRSTTWNGSQCQRIPRCYP